MPGDPVKEPLEPEVRNANGRFVAHNRLGPGRPRGVLNKIPSLIDTAVKMGYDPAALVLGIVADGVVIERDGRITPVDPAERFRMLRECMAYLWPKAPVQIQSDHEHRHLHFDVTELLKQPGAAEAAETLALALLDQPEQQPGEAVLDAEFEPVPADDKP